MKNKFFNYIIVLFAIFGVVLGVMFYINGNCDVLFSPALFSDYYNDKIELFKQENQTASDIEVAFVGDSITDMYDVKSYYSELNVLNRGIGGDTTYGVENRLEVSLYAVKPKVVVMMIGVNNRTTCCRNYERLLVKIKNNLPDSKIVILSLIPAGGSIKSWNTQLQRNNVIIKDIATRHDCIYVDMYSVFYDSAIAEINPTYTDDGLHPNADGYAVMTNVLKPRLKELLNK